MMKKTFLILVPALLIGVPLTAQRSLEANCARPEVTAANAADACYAAVQAAVSGQPALGLLIAGGNPTIGTSGGTGMRLGTIPRTSAGLRLNLVGVRLPGIIADDIPGRLGEVTEKFGTPVPAILGDITIGITSGVSVAPGLGGIGALSLVGSASYLPMKQLGIDGFEDAPQFAYGVGGRVHILSESFFVPGVSASLIRRSLGTIEFGDVCPSGLTNGTPFGSDPVTLAGVCTTDGDAGEFRTDLVDWSGRVVASKNLLGFGLSAGVGFDRYQSSMGYGFRGDDPEDDGVAAVYRVARADLESERWTLFGSASYTLLVGTFGIEAGWQQGEPPITGFRDLQSNFDPESGIWFASIGTRLSL